MADRSAADLREQAFHTTFSLRTAGDGPNGPVTEPNAVTEVYRLRAATYQGSLQHRSFLRFCVITFIYLYTI